MRPSFHPWTGKWTPKQHAALFCSLPYRCSAQASPGLWITLFSARSLPRSVPSPFSAPQPRGTGVKPQAEEDWQEEAAVIDATRESEHLAQANRHIALAQQYIAQQKELIQKLDREGAPLISLWQCRCSVPWRTPSALSSGIAS
jgi:hypothetical protein